MSAQERENGSREAAAQYDTIAELVADLNAAIEADDDDKREEIEQRIHEEPLSVMVRDGWREPGGQQQDGPEEFEILLCTGGPAVRIIGELSGGFPTVPRLQHQDWFTPWADWKRSDEITETLLTFCRCFWFGE